jgi:hypothetical protein
MAQSRCSFSILIRYADQVCHRDRGCRQCGRAAAAPSPSQAQARTVPEPAAAAAARAGSGSSPAAAPGLRGSAESGRHWPGHGPGRLSLRPGHCLSGQPETREPVSQ